MVVVGMLSGFLGAGGEDRERGRRKGKEKKKENKFFKR